MIIVYQSLNSGAQQVCGFKRKRSATNGYFTREASKYYADNDNIHMITNTPTKSRYAPTYGGLYSGIKLPKTGTFGESVSCSSYSTPSENGIVENKDLVSCVIRQMLNEINYMYVGQPELIVLGEIYLEEDFKCYGYKVEKLYDNKRACQCFTVLKKINAKGSISTMASNSDPSFPIIECNGVKIAFVHIPNKYIPNSDQIVNFLKGDTSNVDIIMGDTNIGTPTLLNTVGDGLWKRTSSMFPARKKGAYGAAIHPGPQGYGTNAKENLIYDSGISRGHVSNLSKSVPNYSKGEQGPQPACQFLGVLSKRIVVNGKAVTYSDHNGLVINVQEPPS